MERISTISLNACTRISLGDNWGTYHILELVPSVFDSFHVASKETDLKPLQVNSARIRKRCCAVLWRDQLMDSREVRLSNSPGRLDSAIEVERHVSNQHAQFLQRLEGRGPSAYFVYAW